MSYQITLRDAERSLNDGIRELDHLSESMTAIEDCNSVPQDVCVFSHATREQVGEIRNKLRELFTLIYVTRLTASSPITNVG